MTHQDSGSYEYIEYGPVTLSWAKRTPRLSWSVHDRRYVQLKGPAWESWQIQVLCGPCMCRRNANGGSHWIQSQLSVS